MPEQTHMTDSTAESEAEAVVQPMLSPEVEAGAPELDDDLVAMADELESIVDARNVRLRRVADVVLALLALVVLAPFMLLVGIAIKLDSSGPVFYTQDRIGINRRRRERRRATRAAHGRRVVIRAGRPFKIWKFRTMRQDAEAAGPQWAQKDDPRVTPVGHLLRKTRLDEVPQFFNVLRGDMTLIGPRPERSFFIKMLESEIPHYSKRLLVKPGITGFAQVHNGYDDSIESVRRKVAWDLRYIRSQGPNTDMQIVVKTVRTILTGEGAC
ncbi:MAG: sugar transferase [Candidatus Krumholzibacteriia bacterium]